MYIPEPKGGGDFELAPEGTHLGICYRVLDIGTQESNYNGDKKFDRKLFISWEIHGHNMADGRPMTIGKRYKLSGHKKSSLRKDLEAWRNMPFKDEDFGPEGKFKLKNLLGAICMMNVQHTPDGQYANIVAIMAPPKGTPKQPAQNPMLILSLNPGEFDKQVYDSLSDNLRETIAKSPEYMEIMKPKKQNGHNTYDDARNGGGIQSEEIPF